MEKMEKKGPPKKEDSMQFDEVFKLKDNDVEKQHFALATAIANELRILQSIHQTLETNSDIVSLIPGFFEARETFKSFVCKISQKYSELKETLINSYLKVASALRNYGVMTDNTDIIALSNLKASYLKNCSDYELIHHANVMFENVKLYFTTLNYFGISHETVDSFQTIVNKFSYAAGILGENVFDRTPWKEEIDRDFDEAYSFIHDTLDSYLERIKEKFPRFYTEYTTAKTSLYQRENS
ncbi:MAG: hypothetical protein Q8858_09460 [Bacteroidota bacterium]|nr:hypothetical protein [Bacteroidota bacterium]